MFTLVPGVGLVQAPSASAFVNAPGGLVQFVIASGGSFIASWAIAARGQIHGAGRGH